MGGGPNSYVLSIKEYKEEKLDFWFHFPPDDKNSFLKIDKLLF